MSQTNFHIHVTQWAKLLFSFCGVTAPSGPGPPHCLGFMITLKTHHTWYDSSGQVISPMQRPDNTALTICNSSKRAAADQRLGLCSHWDWPSKIIVLYIFIAKFLDQMVHNCINEPFKSGFL